MNKTIRYQEVKVVDRVLHEFYCEECEAYIGKSLEDYDGYYNDLGLIHLTFKIENNYFTLEKRLCDSCRGKLTTNIANVLVLNGFQEKK